MNRIKVHLDKRASLSYEICIGNDILDRVALLIAKRNFADNYFVIADSNVASLYGKRLTTVLSDMNLTAELLEFPAGESSKTMTTILSLVDTLMQRGADRTSGLIAFGGGVTGDITGFAASIYMRSIPFIQIPTTLLAQVDSSIGGKTGVDLTEGKNLLGTFYQPKAVFIDLQFLQTLPDGDIENGMAEIIKYGIVDDPDLFALMESETDAILRRDMDVMETLIAQSCKIKKDIVEIDEKDMGIRRMLNFGHTVGHAVEAASDFTIPHGNAVAIGMIASSRISEKLHYLPRVDRVRIETLIHKLGLPCRLPHTMRTVDILPRLKMDKKKKGTALHFVLLKRLGIPFINDSVGEDIIRDTLEELYHDG